MLAKQREGVRNIYYDGVGTNQWRTSENGIKMSNMKTKYNIHLIYLNKKIFNKLLQKKI